MVLTFTVRGDYLLPDIKLSEPPPELVDPLGRYVQLRQRHLKEHRTMTYNTLLLSESYIALHRVAKKYFDELGYGKNKKLSSIAELKKEYAELLTEKKKTYAGYRESKERMTALLTARENAKRMLGLDKTEPARGRAGKER